MTGGTDRRPARAPRTEQAGYVLALLGLAAGVAGLWFWPQASLAAAQPAAARAAARTGEPPPPQRWVDPADARLAALPAWADPRWLERLNALLAAEPPFALEPEPPDLAPLAAALASLSFVERVERLDATPAGLVLDLVLRKPVACIDVGGEFALVDADGVVLEGRWPLPPRLGRAHLPVLGPLEDPLLARARPGDWLAEPEHTDALDVALSLAEEVPEAQRAALGRIVIDARSARRASPEEPGVRLELEGGRLALFGRSPAADEPGELAAAAKWRGLVRAFDWFAQDPAANDWLLVDLRWDRPDLAPARPLEVAQVEPAPFRSSAGSSRAGARASGPRVR
ncbi:MAG TPA: hypothetical protein VF530_23795 [Planctomycetota bacterium]